jgi:peptidoglycan/LPS O-acetylase OafA/YrhL
MIPGTALSETEVPAKTGRRIELERDRPSDRGAQGRAISSEPRAVPRFYRPELDALRLVAFLMVWFSHSLPSAGEGAARGLAPGLIRSIEAIKDAGNFGVCVFFFLSAYLITELLRRERLATGTVHLRAFYLRRILRIWPLYLGVLAAYGLLGLRFHGFRIEPGRLLASLLLAGNWYIAFHPAILTPMRALWSLSVEEQFYLGWPVLARFAGPPLIAGVCLLLLLIGQLTLVWLARDAARQSMLHITAWVNSLVQFQFFALGAWTALALSGRQPRFPLVLRSALLLAACIAMLVAAGVFGIKRLQPCHSSAALTGGYLLTGLGCVLLFAAVLGLPGRIVPLWAVRLGQVSFGLYVFHETGFFFADTLEKHLRFPAGDEFQNTHWVLALVANKALSLAFTIALAFASYHFWEKPFLRLKDRFTFIPTRQA